MSKAFSLAFDFSSFIFSGFQNFLLMFWVAWTPLCCLGSSGSISVPSRTHPHKSYRGTTHSATAHFILKCKNSKKTKNKIPSPMYYKMLYKFLHQNNTNAAQKPSPNSYINSHIFWLENAANQRLLQSCSSQPVSV